MNERLRHLPEAARIVVAKRRLDNHEKWSVEQLRAHQRERLLAIIRYAATHSSYYRERFAGIDLSDDLDLAALPPLDKGTVVEHFDELVTDPRLTLTAIERHMAEFEGTDTRSDPKLFGEYRAMASGGTSGHRGVFVYGRADWIEFAANLARFGDAYLDLGPRLPRRRFVNIVADQPMYLGGRISRSMDIGIHRTLRLDARAPIGELVERLNAFQPEGLNTYPSTGALLAERQLAGELRIKPRTVAMTGEVLSTELEEFMVAAWGRTPFNQYGSTEMGYIAVDCDRHAGLHVFEDQIQLEVLDDEYRPVPAGEPGSRLLVTNLFNRTQPLIRYELNDLVTVSPNPCPCGRPFPILDRVEGRNDDILELPAIAGGTVKVNPLVLCSPLDGMAALSEYRIVYAAGGLHVAAVLAGAGGQQALNEIKACIGAALAEQDALVPPIRVEPVAEIPRHPHSGKHKAVEVQNA